VKVVYRLKSILLLLATALISSMSYSSVQLPDCEITEELTTPIHFFTSEDILQKYSKKEVSYIVENWFDFSRRTMQNSCIPLKRSLVSITYLKNVNKEMLHSLGAAKYAIESTQNIEVDDFFPEGIIGYVGVLVDSYKGFDLCGRADIGNNFFLVALNCPNNTMEHELGHLSGAGHDLQTALTNHGSIENARHMHFPKSKEYAFAWRCANSGTVMSYAQGESLPVYSSPDVYVDGQQCGNERFGNNAQALRDFAAGHLTSKH
jgi:hypothetical protein